VKITRGVTGLHICVGSSWCDQIYNDTHPLGAPQSFQNIINKLFTQLGVLLELDAPETEDFLSS
jgi:hypothetical protein